MTYTRYGYANAISGFFEFPTKNARALLPSGLEPMEIHHGSSILSVTCFDFDDSEVGPYGEVVMAVLVAPFVEQGKRLPKSAFYPYLVATTTQAARTHAIERWHLPHYMEDVDMRFTPGDGMLTAEVFADEQKIVSLSVSQHTFNPVSHLYQSFMNDAQGAYLANIVMEGAQSEHENERGQLFLGEHRFHDGLNIPDVDSTPFRELWMRQGTQTFDPLITRA